MTRETSKAAHFRPDGWPTVTPRFFTHDAGGVVGFLKSVFDAYGEMRCGAVIGRVRAFCRTRDRGQREGGSMVSSTMSGKCRQSFGHDVTDWTVRAYSSVGAAGMDRTGTKQPAREL
jgi:hypothetical protein